MKKGSRDGITILNQVYSPSAALFNANFGYLKIPIKTQNIIIINKNYLKKSFLHI